MGVPFLLLDSVAALSPGVEWVYIETSGVADPARVSAYARTWPGYRLAGVVVLANVTRVRQQVADKYIGATVGLDHLVGHPENLVATSKSAEAHGITKPLRNQAFV